MDGMKWEGRGGLEYSGKVEPEGCKFGLNWSSTLIYT